MRQQQQKQKNPPNQKKKSLPKLFFFNSFLREIGFYSLRGSSTVKFGHYLYRQSPIWAGVSEGPDLVLFNCTTRRYLTRGTCCFVPSTRSHTGNRFRFFPASLIHGEPLAQYFSSYIFMTSFILNYLKAFTTERNEGLSNSKISVTRIRVLKEA